MRGLEGFLQFAAEGLLLGEDLGVPLPGDRESEEDLSVSEEGDLFCLVVLFGSTDLDRLEDLDLVLVC